MKDSCKFKIQYMENKVKFQNYKLFKVNVILQIIKGFMFFLSSEIILLYGKVRIQIILIFTWN